MLFQVPLAFLKHHCEAFEGMLAVGDSSSGFVEDAPIHIPYQYPGDFEIFLTAILCSERL